MDIATDSSAIFGLFFLLVLVFTIAIIVVEMYVNPKQEKRLQGFMEEKPGVLSSIRFQMIITLLFAFFITYQETLKEEPNLTLILLLFTAAFVPKVISKFAEMKNNL